MRHHDRPILRHKSQPHSQVQLGFRPTGVVLYSLPRLRKSLGVVLHILVAPYELQMARHSMFRLFHGFQYDGSCSSSIVSLLCEIGLVQDVPIHN
jgi:hypothetical protein